MIGILAVIHDVLIW